MRIALAAIFQLTNTFSRQLTTADDFNENWQPDSDLIRCDPFEVNHLVQSVVNAARGRDVEVVPILTAIADSSGPVTNMGIKILANRLSERLKDSGPTMDALILVLSGAMVSEDWRSADMSLIQTARATLKTGVPIVAVFDTHANLSQELVDSVDLALSFAPGTEVNVLKAAGGILRRTEEFVRRDIRPVKAFRKLPLQVPLIMQNSSIDPMRSLRTIACEFETAHGVVDVSLFPGFPYSDVQHSGFSLVVTTNNDVDNADSLAQRLQMSVWDKREQFASTPLNVETAVHEAMLTDDGPVVIADAGDDPTAGAAGDGTGLLWAMIDLGAPDATLGVIVDPAGVARAIDAGIARQVRLDIGGSIDPRAGYPVNVTARVCKISDGCLDVDGRCRMNVGRAVVLDIQGRHGGQIDVIMTERSPATVEPALFTALGIEIARKQIIGVKMSMNVRETFGSLATKILEISTPGITTPVLSYFDYERVSRPIYPLDKM